MRGRALALAAACVLAACGRAGPPVAPEVRVPMAISDLRGVIEDGAVALTWTNPQRRVDQSRVRDLTEARIYRSEDDGVVPPKPALLTVGKIAGYREIAVIPLLGSVPRGQGQTVQFVDREGLRFGRRYTYVAVVEDSRGRVSPPSTRVSVRFIAPPEAPPAPEVDAGDGEVRVRWRPPARLLDDTAPGPLTYEVSRAGAVDGPAEAVFPVPAGETSFLDQGLENDRTYYYGVRAIRDDAGTVARGALSPRVAATPGRTTPPSPPTNLVAAPSGRAVRLSWTPSPDANVVTYVVYRAAARGDLARIGSVRAPVTT
ncbi:MAG TPA: hypothetical protein VGJ70_11285, partial [Solirubrobacteraceae bacterium]